MTKHAVEHDSTVHMHLSCFVKDAKCSLCYIKQHEAGNLPVCVCLCIISLSFCVTVNVQGLQKIVDRIV